MNYTGLFGFDISTYQDAPGTPAVVDFRKMRDYGGRFVIIKAGQGNWEDPDFETNWRNAKGILPRATYWYYDNRYPPKEQARKYFDIIRQDVEGMCWLDLEDKKAGVYAGWRNWYEFIAELQSIYPGVRVGIYTGFFYWVEMLTYANGVQRTYFGQFPLWLANYQPDPFHPNYNSILVPLPWLAYDILQSGTPAIGHEVGVESAEIDFNQFNGDEAKFAAMFGGTTEQPQEGIIMARYEAVSVYPMSLRPDHNTANAPLGSVPAQSRMQGDEIWMSGTLEKWLKVTSVNGQPVKDSAGRLIAYAWVAIVAVGRIYCSLNEITPPPAQELPNRFALSVDGVNFKWYVAE